VLFNEPKLLKFIERRSVETAGRKVSVLFNEPKLLKFPKRTATLRRCVVVSVLFNEPKLLKLEGVNGATSMFYCFSALQRAEIAEIRRLQRACG